MTAGSLGAYIFAGTVLGLIAYGYFWLWRWDRRTRNRND
jgi:hypothetical protein